MRTHTRFYVAAMMALANLFTACGSEIVTVEKIVEKTVLVCLDEAHTQVEAGQSCPDGEKPVAQYVCAMNGQTVVRSEECPTLMLVCPDGTTPYGNTSTGEHGCTYDATCHEGWAYEPSTKTCKKFCQIGETLSADGLTCATVPVGGLIYVGSNTPDRPMTEEIRPGWYAFLFALNIRTGGPQAALDGAAFDLYVSQTGEHSTWDNRKAVVEQYVAGCFLTDTSTNSRTPEMPVSITSGTEEDASVQFYDGTRVATGSNMLAHLECRTNPALQMKVYVVAVLRSVLIKDAQTGTPLNNIAWGSLNKDFSQQSIVSPPSACSAPAISLASGSPNGAAVPSFGEVLRFNAKPSCEGTIITGLSIRVLSTDNAGTGWNGPGLNATRWHLYGRNDPTAEILAGHWSFNGHGVELTGLDADPVERILLFPDVPLFGEGETFSLFVDASGASSAQDDLLRADITGMCWRAANATESTCMQMSTVTDAPPLVTGGTLIF